MAELILPRGAFMGCASGESRHAEFMKNIVL
jgi:hypothetical protein